MPTLVDFPDDQLEVLRALSAAQGRSRAALIREALSAYLAEHDRKAAAAKPRPKVDGFGLSSDLVMDGLAYQGAMRDGSYDAWLTRKIEAGRADVAGGRWRENEVVEAEFAGRRDGLAACFDADEPSNPDER